MMWGNGYNMAWGWPVGLLMLVAVIVLVIWIARALAGGTDRGVLRGGSSAGRGQSGRSQARQILDDRFAKGELNESEYRERLKVLDR